MISVANFQRMNAWSVVVMQYTMHKLIDKQLE